MAENRERPADAAPPTQPAGAVRPMSAEEIRQAEQAMSNQIMADVLERDPMNGPDGGVFIVDGQKVDAEGKPVKDKKD